jgi:hypothetical protein
VLSNLCRFCILAAWNPWRFVLIRRHKRAKDARWWWCVVDCGLNYLTETREDKTRTRTPASAITRPAEGGSASSTPPNSLVGSLFLLSTFHRQVLGKPIKGSGLHH